VKTASLDKCNIVSVIWKVDEWASESPRKIEREVRKTGFLKFRGSGWFVETVPPAVHIIGNICAKHQVSIVGSSRDCSISRLYVDISSNGWDRNEDFLNTRLEL
jgi:hypothetical protein